MGLMMEGTLSLVVGLVAGIAAYYVYPATGLYSAMIVGFGTAWLLFGLTGPSRLLSMLRFTFNPPMAGLIAFFLAFIYMSVESYPFWESFLVSSIIAVLGGLAGFLFFRLWNIGS